MTDGDFGSFDELQQALVSNLTARGVIPDIKAQLHGEIMGTIQRGDDAPPPRPPPAALLINDLVREYLAYTGYNHSLAAFNLETGHKDEVGRGSSAGGGRVTSMPRAFLAEELDVVDLQQAQASPTPLLYALVGSATAARLERLGEAADSAPRLPGSRKAAYRPPGGGGSGGSYGASAATPLRGPGSTAALVASSSGRGLGSSTSRARGARAGAGTARSSGGGARDGKEATGADDTAYSDDGFESDGGAGGESATRREEEEDADEGGYPGAPPSGRTRTMTGSMGAVATEADVGDATFRSEMVVGDRDDSASVSEGVAEAPAAAAATLVAEQPPARTASGAAAAVRRTSITASSAAAAAAGPEGRRSSAGGPAAQLAAVSAAAAAAPRRGSGAAAPPARRLSTGGGGGPGPVVGGPLYVPGGTGLASRTGPQKRA